MKVRARRDSWLRCALCHAELARDGGWTCPGCATQVHRSCAEATPRCPTLGCRERVRVRVERSVATLTVVWYAVRAAFAGALGFLAWAFGSLGLDELQRQFHPGFGRLGAGVQPAPLWESFVL